MISWFAGLSGLQQAYAAVALPATVILILQTILLLFGLGGHGASSGTESGGFEMGHDIGHDIGHDTGHETGHDSHQDSGLRVFTVRGIVAFFSIGGWAGVASLEWGVPPAFSAFLALIGGLAALFAVAWIIKLSLKLQDAGNIDIANAVGHVAQVYLTIPGGGVHTGKVVLNLQERYTELNAVTPAPAAIHTGSAVVVTGVLDDSTVTVEPIAGKEIKYF